MFLRHRHRTDESYKRGIYNRLALIFRFLSGVSVLFLVSEFVFTLVLFSFQKEDRYVMHFIHFLKFTAVNLEQKIERSLL